ncbi:MAG: glycine/sarcosine/betaine reductase selenoprotein B family protein [Anaerolineae bacterium]
MEIVENLEQWRAAFRDGWFAHYKKTGELYWRIYARPRNRTAPSGPAVDLARSRLMLISTAGGHLKDSQEPFDAASKLGDYTIRLFPHTTPFEAIAYAHDHYDHAAVNADPQVLLPLQHLRDMVSEGKIGELAPSVASFSGYQPDVGRVLEETIPAILEVARKEEVQAALLVPA